MSGGRWHLSTKTSPPRQTKATLARKVTVARDSYLFTLDVPREYPEPQPGQFVQVTTLAELVLRRPFSVAGFRDGRHLELLVEVRGKGTRGFAEAEYGSTVDILGPLGNAFTPPAEAESAVLVAGGIGVAGLRYLAEKLLVEAHRTLALVGDRTRDALLDHLFPEPAGGGRYRVMTATDDGTAGFHGAVTSLLEDQIGRLEGNARIYACGPRAMVREVARIASASGLPCEVLMEEIMACGVGACRGCVIETEGGYRTACKDGPVFDAADLVLAEADDDGP
ncbi:MAG: dihydroorotate dehydrogenase electron transfer subunit [Candidatus Eisenbacteria bacterium]|nr:dihydroorotate dehydrogenase electron transfer subunit [Candidatus Eisenbacteria bacterium]